MADGIKALDELIARVRALPDMGKRVAPRAAELMRAGLERTMAQGQDPNGVPHKPRKKDGRAPLTNAAKSLFVHAIDGSVYVRLVGVEAQHHLGHVTGETVRQLIPVHRVPDDIALQIAAVCSFEFLATMGQQ